MKFIHLTDTHLTTPGRTIYGLDPDARLAAAVADINARHGDAAFAIITGDLANRGERPAYEALRRHLAKLGMPCHLVAGNHDEREMLCEVFPEIPRMPEGFIQYEVDVRDDGGTVRLIVLDTVDPGSAVGTLCERRLAWLRDALDRAADLPVLVFLHHPPVALGIPELDDVRLSEHRELAAVLSGRANVRHLFFGHVHRPAWGTWSGIGFSALSSTNHQSALVLERLGGIVDDHEPPAYAVVRVDADGDVVVNLNLFLDDSPRYFITGPDAISDDATASQLLTDRRVPPKYRSTETGYSDA